MMQSKKNVEPNLRKKLILYVNKHFKNQYEALESLGYKKLEEAYKYNGDYYETFEKDGELYVYREMDCCNNYIYNVFISPLEERNKDKDMLALVQS
ncbi:hypothetical protein [Clostridium thailandense]|uniref:Uncharacterized protein n=1 Tax=Clostridium thailandense TaxID=2794346 RepID=A0A949U4G1_9CLOT|nr:hypothetical protein [Clostridium thailandense]MBV7276298.1 hypothetical protein [Clostridium thailandense]MCH5138056.1 hypothetical protein [Clostridiaceae bacterium UIB06]